MVWCRVLFLSFLFFAFLHACLLCFLVMLVAWCSSFPFLWICAYQESSSKLFFCSSVLSFSLSFSHSLYTYTPTAQGRKHTARLYHSSTLCPVFGLCVCVYLFFCTTSLRLLWPVVVKSKDLSLFSFIHSLTLISLISLSPYLSLSLDNSYAKHYRCITIISISLSSNLFHCVLRRYFSEQHQDVGTARPLEPPIQCRAICGHYQCSSLGDHTLWPGVDSPLLNIWNWNHQHWQLGYQIPFKHYTVARAQLSSLTWCFIFTVLYIQLARMTAIRQL